MYRFPAESMATPAGAIQLRAGGRAVVPAVATVPFPATVVITPFETLRMRLLPQSAMYRFPAESTATPCGLLNCALVAGPLSPLYP